MPDDDWDDGDDRYDQYKDDLAMGYINEDGSQREPDETDYFEPKPAKSSKSTANGSTGERPVTARARRRGNFPKARPMPRSLRSDG